MHDELKVGDKVEILRDKVLFGLRLLKGETHEVVYVGLSGTPYVKGNAGYNVPLNEEDYKRVDSKKDLNRNIKQMEHDVGGNEFVPRFFKRNNKYIGKGDEYFHTKGKGYIEVHPDRYEEYDFGEEDFFEEDIVLYTDCEHTILIYSPEEIEELFEEVK